MRAKAVLAGVATGATTALLALGAVPAAAAPMVRTPSELVLSVAGAGAQSPFDVDRAVTLSCTSAAAGDHPDADAACGSLAGVRGDFTALAPAPTMCSYLYQPVTATEQGVWNGEQVFYQQTFTNRCFLLRATGAVFNF